MSFLQISKPLGIIGLQTDDTLISADKVFEEDAIVAAKSTTKNCDCLITASPNKFQRHKD